MKVAQDTFCWCGQCKLILAHVVLAVKDGIPVKTNCHTCGQTHGYRPHLPGQKPVTTKAPLKTKPKVVTGAVVAKRVRPEVIKPEIPAVDAELLASVLAVAPAAAKKVKAGKKGKAKEPIPPLVLVNHNRQHWESLMKISSEPRQYGTAEVWEVGQTVLHPIFGPGSVVVVEASKVSVWFKDGVKRLMAGNAQ